MPKKKVITQAIHESGVKLLRATMSESGGRLLC